MNPLEFDFLMLLKTFLPDYYELHKTKPTKQQIISIFKGLDNVDNYFLKKNYFSKYTNFSEDDFNLIVNKYNNLYVFDSEKNLFTNINWRVISEIRENYKDEIEEFEKLKTRYCMKYICDFSDHTYDALSGKYYQDENPYHKNRIKFNERFIRNGSKINFSVLLYSIKETMNEFLSIKYFKNKSEYWKRLLIIEKYIYKVLDENESIIMFYESSFDADMLNELPGFNKFLIDPFDEYHDELQVLSTLVKLIESLNKKRKFDLKKIVTIKRITGIFGTYINYDSKYFNINYEKFGKEIGLESFF
jgi:hypothetical protein